MAMRNGVNTGAGPRGQMQRVPSRQNGTAAGEAERNAAPSPLLGMARRIRDEQGVSGLRDFLSAMAPFSAPNELRSVAEGFGMDYDEIKTQHSREQFAQPAPQPAFPQNGMGFDPRLLNMMQQPARPNRGMDPMQLMQLIPMLQGMKNGGGGPNIANLAQLMKMMGG